MNNEDEICSFQFNIKLPDGINIIKEYNEDDEYVESINLTNRKKSSHELSFKQTKDGGYFLIAYSLSNSTFRNKNGAIVNIKVKANKNMQCGNYGVVISNALMVTPDEKKIEQKDYSGTLSITTDNGIENFMIDRYIQMYLVNNTIVIEGLPQSGIVELYNISGQKLTSVKGNGNKTMIDCSIYKKQTLVLRAINNKKEVKTFKFNL